jgi:hypothetical protein
MFLFTFIRTTCIIKFSINLFSEFLFFSLRATFCFIDPDYLLIRMTFPSTINSY